MELSVVIARHDLDAQTAVRGSDRTDFSCTETVYRDADCGPRVEGEWRVAWPDGCGFVTDSTLFAIIDLDPSAGTRSARLALVGELCAYSAPILTEALDEVVDRGSRDIVLYLGDLRLCTSAGIAVIQRARDRVNAMGGTLRLREPHGIVDRVLLLTHTPEDDCIVPTSRD